MTRAYWGTILSVDDSVGRLYDTLEGARPARQHDHRLHGRQRPAQRRARHGRQADDARAEHPHPAGRALPGPDCRRTELARQPRVDRPAGAHARHRPVASSTSAASPRCRRPTARSWEKLVQGDAAGWRTAWFYEYNYEKQFPYTPNVRGVRTDGWKYIHYPHGDGSPDRHMAELYDLQSRPRRNHQSHQPARARRRPSPSCRRNCSASWPPPTACPTRCR